MKITLQPHWAERLRQLEAEDQQLRQNPAVVQYLRAKQEEVTLMRSLALDAGHKMEDFAGAKVEQDGPNTVLVLVDPPTKKE